jgi:hypothetical protein
MPHRSARTSCAGARMPSRARWIVDRLIRRRHSHSPPQIHRCGQNHPGTSSGR